MERIHQAAGGCQLAKKCAAGGVRACKFPQRLLPRGMSDRWGAFRYAANIIGLKIETAISRGVLHIRAYARRRTALLYVSHAPLAPRDKKGRGQRDGKGAYTHIYTYTQTSASICTHEQKKSDFNVSFSTSSRLPHGTMRSSGGGAGRARRKVDFLRFDTRKPVYGLTF